MKFIHVLFFPDYAAGLLRRFNLDWTRIQGTADPQGRGNGRRRRGGGGRRRPRELDEFWTRTLLINTVPVDYPVTVVNRRGRRGRISAVGLDSQPRLHHFVSHRLFPYLITNSFVSHQIFPLITSKRFTRRANCPELSEIRPVVGTHHHHSRVNNSR